MPGLAVDKPGAEGIRESYLVLGGDQFFAVRGFLEHKGSGHLLAFTILLDHRALVKGSIFRPLDIFPREK